MVNDPLGTENISVGVTRSVPLSAAFFKPNIHKYVFKYVVGIESRSG